MYAFLVLVVVLLLLFAFVDTWYMLRTLVFHAPKRAWQVWFGGQRQHLSRDDLLQATSVQGVVLPSDLDFHFHMNNSKYLREMDFGRFNHYLLTGLLGHILSVGGYVVVATTTIRYRRSLQLWERFTLQTRILCWEGSTLYLEQRFVKRDGFVCAVALLSMSVGVPLEKVLERACGDVPKSPTFPPEVDSFAETIARSKERFRMERTN